MKVNRNNILFILFLALLVACTPGKRHKTLSFFFDGVPEPKSAEEIFKADSILVQNNPADSAIGLIAATPSIYFHYPYQEKECMFCHDENAVGELTSAEPDLCYTCHTDFNYLFEKLHGPVDAGFCTTCHEPHMSKNAKLTILPGNTLCFYCHTSFENKTPDYHIELDGESCIECHNPHGEGELTALHLEN